MQGVHICWPVFPLGRQCTSGAAAGLKPPHKGLFQAALGHGAVGVVPPACLLQQSCVQSCNVIDMSYTVITTLS